MGLEVAPVCACEAAFAAWRVLSLDVMVEAMVVLPCWPIRWFCSVSRGEKGGG